MGSPSDAQRDRPENPKSKQSRCDGAGPGDVLVVSFNGDGDPENPRSFSTARKWLIVLVVSVTSLSVAFTSSIYTGAYGQMQAELGMSEIVATLGLSLYVAGLGLSPMLLAPLSEVRVKC